jgi:ABC-type uncharacterized transport system auxiliary subunit
MKARLYFIIPFILVFTGCMSEKTIVMRYYVMAIPASHPSNELDSSRPINVICKIDETETNPVLETNQIINRSNSHEITYYKYHQWAIRPSIAVKEMVQNRITSSGIFQKVYARQSRSIPDYRFVTTLSQLEVIENSDSFSAHVNLAFAIIHNADDQVILGHQADRTNALNTKDLNLFVKEVSQIIYEELNVFINKIEDNRSLFGIAPSR